MGPSGLNNSLASRSVSGGIMGGFGPRIPGQKLLEELEYSVLNSNKQRSQLGQDAYRGQAGQAIRTSSKLGGGGFMSPTSSSNQRFGG